MEKCTWEGTQKQTAEGTKKRTGGTKKQTGGRGTQRCTSVNVTPTLKMFIQRWCPSKNWTCDWQNHKTFFHTLSLKTFINGVGVENF